MRDCVPTRSSWVLLGLLLSVSWAARGAHANIIESFSRTQGADSEALPVIPGLWQQPTKASAFVAGGRGAGSKGYAMELSSFGPTAETTLLSWDGRNRLLIFYYLLDLASKCETGALKVSMSCNSIDWEELKTLPTEKMQIAAYVVIQVPLKLNSTCRQFAVKWDYAACYTNAYLYLDDITLPALMPSTTSPDKRNGEQPPSTDAGSETKTVPDKASPIPQNGGGPTSGTGTDTGVGKPGEKAAAGPGGGSIINTNENKPAITVVTPKPERSAASRPHASGAVALLVLACVSACLLL